jgi:hypothetical protein
MLRHAFCIIVAVVAVIAQEPSRSLLQTQIKGNGIGSIAHSDLRNQAAVYCVNADLISERNTNTVPNYVRGNLGDYFNVNDIRYYNIDTAQYEILCEMFNLTAKSNQTMLVLYHNKQAAQFAFDESGTRKIDLASEFKKLGWLPLQTRLNNFLELNPKNQDALAVLFSSNTVNLMKLAGEYRISMLGLPPAEMAILRSQYPELTPDGNTLPNLVQSLKKINDAGKPDWMYSRNGNSSLMVVERTVAAVPSLLESSEFQRELNAQLALIESELARYPFSSPFYGYWAAFANMAKNPDPRKLLSQISFPPGSRSVPENLYTLATPFFNNTIITVNNSGIEADTKEGFKFIDELQEWIEAQSIDNGDIFNECLLALAVEKIKNSTLHQHSAEIEQYLEGMRYKLGQNWPKLVAAASPWLSIVKGIMPNPNKLEEILALPTIDKLPATIRIEKHEYLGILTQFIRQNPENFDAMDMYCEEAAKFLPDDDLETQILAYSARTGTPPNLQAYSKMDKKDDWSHLAAKIISELLFKLEDAPCFADSSNPARNPWTNLNRWEDLDMQKNAIDWYGFFKNPHKFWYKPAYYMQRESMPDTVFKKYIAQAEKANDWMAVLNACEARFGTDKRNCRDEQILQVWNNAESALRLH